MILKAGLASYGALTVVAVTTGDLPAILTAVTSTGIATAYVTYHEFYVRPAKARELSQIHIDHANRVDRIRRESQEDTDKQLARQYEHFVTLHAELKRQIQRLEKAANH